jgi:CRISPR-associated endoribonuclease Cas6
MPSRWLVTLPGIDAATVRPEYLHAVVSGWFEDDATAHRADAKPYTVSPAHPAETGTAVQISLLNDTCIDRLHSAAAPGARIRLGSARTWITHPPQPLEAVTWDELCGTSNTNTAWCLRFVTPTTFRRGNNFTPSPSLRAILGSLRRSWQLAPIGVTPVQVQLTPEPVWLTDIDVASHVVKINGFTVSGFTGRLRFACDAGPHVAAAVDQLVRLAPYAGVGAYTTRGFGVVCPEQTWAQPLRPRTPHRTSAPHEAVKRDQPRPSGRQ